jgi:hypothetical protein
MASNSIPPNAKDRGFAKTLAGLVDLFHSFGDQLALVLVVQRLDMHHS